MGLEMEAMLLAAAKSLFEEEGAETDQWQYLCHALGRALQAAASAGPQPISPAEFVRRYATDKPPVIPDDIEVTGIGVVGGMMDKDGNITPMPQPPTADLYWPAKPNLPSVIFRDISNSTADGRYVEFSTMYAREYALLEYADEVKKVAHALVDRAREARDQAEKRGEQRGRAMEEAERPVYIEEAEQAARQQGMGIAMEIVAKHAKGATSEPAVELALRRAWEEILVRWRTAKP